MNLAIFDPLYTAVAWILSHIHDGLKHITTAGWTWGLSIILLTMAMRLILFPLFMKQMKSQREMQLLQPKIAEIRKKFPDDRQKQSQEQMQLFKDHGVNPLAGCLPLLVQMPIFFALFGVLHKFVPNKGTISDYSSHYGLSKEVVKEVATSKIFGVPIAASFNSSKAELARLNAHAGTVKTVTIVMILLMMASSFLTARQMLARSKKQGQQLDGAQATTQKIMVYGMPLFFGIIGVNFQMGVLLYWLTTNVWTFGQQALVIKRMGDDPEAIVRERKAKESAATPAKAGTGTSLSKPTGKQTTGTKAAKPGVAAAVPVTTPSASGSPRSSGQRRSGSSGRPASRKRKGGRH